MFRGGGVNTIQNGEILKHKKRRDDLIREVAGGRGGVEGSSKRLESNLIHMYMCQSLQQLSALGSGFHQDGYASLCRTAQHSTV